MTEQAIQKTKKRANVKSKQVVALLDKLTEGNGLAIMRHLQERPESLEDIARDIATGSAVEVLSKLVRTQTRSIEWVTEADFDYVGLPAEAATCGFHTGFETYIRQRVGKRADGFAVMFNALDRYSSPYIIETGCLRVPRNWEGDGQSTFQFDWYAREKRGHVTTIDINAESIDSARRACSSVTSTILNDSVATLNALSAQAKQPASLIYLDSFDLDLSDPIPSATHHAMEVMAARNLMGPGTILCIDDFDVPPLGPGGKGLIVDQFMKSVNAEVLYSGYQKVWRISS
ncbi:hypothetical protein [Gluconacetobacter entanii]|nr:hypothetical protein [Gluconacetobacter entanii]MCW4584341.1 hypothetical protein [Gluconacetobacter entanii]MCW4587755.1 hypothetical protein [Gluconacetobacter entanii]